MTWQSVYIIQIIMPCLSLDMARTVDFGFDENGYGDLHE